MIYIHNGITRESTGKPADVTLKLQCGFLQLFGFSKLIYVRVGQN